MIERTVLPEVERDVAEVVACADCSRVAALRQVAKLIEADSQVTVLTTKREGGICQDVSYGSTSATGFSRQMR